MHIDVACRPEDLFPIRAFQRNQRKVIVILLVYGIALLALGGYGFVRQVTNGDPDLVASLLAGISIGFGVVLLAVVPRRLVKGSRQEVASAVRSVGDGPVRLTISDEGFSMVSTNRTTSILWPAFDKIVQRDEWWFLHLTRRSIMILPNGLLTPDQQAELADFMQRRKLADFVGSGNPAGQGNQP